MAENALLAQTDSAPKLQLVQQKKMCPQTQMSLNDYADYDLEAASFISNCALLWGQGPCVV